jgi:hypothetical protein
LQIKKLNLLMPKLQEVPAQLFLDSELEMCRDLVILIKTFNTLLLLLTVVLNCTCYYNVLIVDQED